MKEYNLKQSIVIVIVGLALLWACLYCFVFPRLVGGGPAKVPLAKNDESALIAGMKYHKEKFGSYPTGSNARIVHVLRGENRDKLILINLGSRSTNKAGEFIDPWGTPYRIILERPNSLTIRSAGIDKAFGSKDDVTTTSPDLRQ